MMKVMFAYLPVEYEGYLCLSQNRFAKVRGDKELIFPLVPATGLTLLHDAGYQVKFVDSVCDSLNLDAFTKQVEDFKPDLLVFESKTPVIKQNWKTADFLKEKFPNMKIAVVGDHVSVLPEETMQNSKVDFVIRGGDFDLGMLKIANFLEGKEKSLPKGLYYREKGQIKNTGDYELVENLDMLPPINRDLFNWRDYHEAWRMYDEFMYMYGSRGCPYRCTFCSWPQMLYKQKVRFRNVQNVLDEMENLVNKYGVKEFFFDDDSFTCNKKWVFDFCDGIKQRGIKAYWGTNGRVDNTDEEMLVKMKEAGCRLIKYGIESVQQSTLDRINKGYTIEQVKKSFALSKKVGILRHGTAMVGYPWETKEDMLNTVKFVKSLDVDSVQFSIPIVYPGTALFKEAEENNWLAFPPGDWEKYDMSQPTLKHPTMTPEEIVKMCADSWSSVYFSPKYIGRKIFRIRNYDDLRWTIRGMKTVLKGHIYALEKTN